MINQFSIWQKNRGQPLTVSKEKEKRPQTPSMLQKYIPALASGGTRPGPEGLAAQRDAWGNAMQQMQGVNATTPLVAGAQALGMGLAGYGMNKAQQANDDATAAYRKRLSDALAGKADNATLMSLATDPYADSASSAAALKMWDRNNPTEDQLLQRRATQLQIDKGSYELDQAKNGASKDDFIVVDGALYNRRTGEWVQNPNGGQTTDDIREYNEAVRQGFKGSLMDYMIQMKKAGASNMNVDMSGGNDKQVFDLMKERFEGVKSAERGVNALREAKHAILSGAVTGPWADERLFMSKVGAALGITDPKVIANTEVFRSAMAQQVAAMIKATVGSTQISNTDRQFAEAAAGGQITLDQNSILRLIDIGERANMQIIDDYQDRLDKVYDPASEDPGVVRSRALYEVNDPTPMPGDITRLPMGEAEADAAYEALPPNAWFQAPDGTIRQKPGAQ